MNQAARELKERMNAGFIAKTEISEVGEYAFIDRGTEIEFSMPGISFALNKNDLRKICERMLLNEQTTSCEQF